MAEGTKGKMKLNVFVHFPEFKVAFDANVYREQRLGVEVTRMRRANQPSAAALRDICSKMQLQEYSS